MKENSSVESTFKSIDKSQDEDEELKKKLASPTLLQDIRDEINKKHIHDEKLKVTLFLVCVTGLLRNPNRRMSMALASNTTTGKDNLIKAVLSHMPDYKSLFLTGATKSTIEDNIVCPILALSEVNLFRKDGANKDILEVIKQRTEGGINKFKKDAETGFKTLKISNQQQGTIIYGTTDEERDAESETRFIFGSMEESFEKHRQVNNKTFENYSNLDALSFELSKEPSWIKKALTLLGEEFEGCDIWLPFAEKLKDAKVNGDYIFDNNSARSMRDIKRILALTSAVTYLRAFERERTLHKERLYLKGEPEDFLQALELSKDFFNQSYEGIDKRLQEVVNIMKKEKGEWIERDFLEKQMKVSKNTMKKYCSNLANLGIIEGNKGSNLSENEHRIYGDIKKEPLRRFNGNKIYYKRCQKGVKKQLIRCQISELRTFLNNKINNNIDTFEETNKEKGVKKKGVNLEKNVKKTNSEKIDTLELTPYSKIVNGAEMVGVM